LLLVVVVAARVKVDRQKALAAALAAYYTVQFQLLPAPLMLLQLVVVAEIALQVHRVQPLVYQLPVVVAV
jgi:hypothetical protein